MSGWLLEAGQVGYQAALGFAATLGFAIWFNVPRDLLLRVACVGTIGFLVRFAARELGLTPAASSFWGAFAIGSVGYLFAHRGHLPRVIFTIPGIIPLVPGIPAYEALVAFLRGDTSRGIENVVRATLVVGALAGGLTAARAVTLRRFDRDTRRS